MRMLASAAVAALAVALSAGASFADELDDFGVPVATVEPASTIFDLGVDVTNVANSGSAVRQYLGSLEPETRSVILSTCEHYMENPLTARNQETLQFCSIAVNG